MSDYDVIVVGAGLAGLVSTTEIARAGKRVLLLDQEGEQSLGGQAWWSFGGLFLVDSPEQRLMGIKDSIALAKQDWTGSAGYDRENKMMITGERSGLNSILILRHMKKEPGYEKKVCVSSQL